MGRTLICRRCSVEFGHIDGFFSILLHEIFGSNLCDGCKKIKRQEAYDHEENKTREYELERQRARARGDEEETRQAPIYGGEFGLHMGDSLTGHRKVNRKKNPFDF